MTKSVHEQAIMMASALDQQAGRYGETLTVALEIDHCLARMVKALEDAAFTCGQAIPCLQQARPLGDQAEDYANAQRQDQCSYAERILVEVQEKLVEAHAHREAAKQAAVHLEGVIGSDTDSCAQAVANACGECKAMVEKCDTVLRRLTENLGEGHDAVGLAKELKEKAEKAQAASDQASSKANWATDAASELTASIDTLALPSAELVDDILNRLKQAADSPELLPEPEELESLAATIREFVDLATKIDSSKVNKRIAAASRAVLHAVNALKML